MKVQLSKLHPDPVNVRRIADKAELEPLVASMKARGQLCPIIVRPDGSPSEWLVTVGSRRVAAARKLGWAEIEAVVLPETSDADATVVSAAENIVRKGMHPVDEWKATRELTGKGLSVQAAANALGLDRATVRRFALLGSLSPKLLNQMAKEPVLPPMRDLRIIALAPIAVQEQALTQVRKDLRGGEIGDDEDEESGARFPWFQVASLCDCVRIPRARAVFDVDAAGVVFEEDLFAEPGSEDQFTCSDVASFLAAQQAAIEAEAAASKGRIVICEANGNQQLVPPHGYVIAWGDSLPKRMAKDDPRKLAKAVIRGGYMVGSVIERVIRPGEERQQEETPSSVEREHVERDPISKQAQAILAGMKTNALGKALTANVPRWMADGSWPNVVELLVTAFLAKNVDLRMGSANGWMTQRAVGAGRLNNRLTLAEAIVRLLTPLLAFDSPLQNFGTSGPAAEWVGKMIGAEAFMERCDTEEVLKGFRRDKLVEIAASRGIDTSGTATAIRARMVGKMPDWRPVVFGAPAPEVDDEEDA